MKKFRLPRILTAIFTAALVIAFTAPATAEDNKSDPDRVVVKVNGEPITQGRYIRALSLVGQQLAQSGRRIPQEAMPQLQRQVLENLIKSTILHQEAVKAGVKATKDEVESGIVEMRTHFASTDQFEAWLKRGGLSMDDLKEEEAKTIQVRKFIAERFESKVQMTEKDAKKYYDENQEEFRRPERVHARHILVTVDENASDLEKAKARRKIQDLAKRIKGGEDFAAVAREASDCPSSARGGDLDYFERGRMVKPFDDAAFSLKPGEVSEVVETQFGYHLIQVLDKTPSEIIAFDKVSDQIIARLKGEKINGEVSQFVEERLAKSNVEYAEN
ncbi:MAG: peptidylprolyl isomerase [Proteobacteria bacterium]|nr:peptidylprolyl isomerase [Pseudomonadota bacterium]